MAGGYKNIQNHPNAGKNDFSKRPEQAGRKRKLVSDTIYKLKEDGVTPVSKSDIKDIYLSLINIPIPELEDLIKDESETALVRIVGQNILSGKGFDIIESMLDRAIGKATQEVNQKVSLNESVTIFKLPDNER